MRFRKLAAITILVAAWAAGADGVPALLHYEGRLVRGGIPVNGNVALVLRLYPNAEPTPGEALLFADAATVPVADGVYATLLGDDPAAGTLTQALANAAVYLEVAVDGAILLPRRRVASAAYALRAGDAERLGGQTAAAYARLDKSNTWTGAGNVFQGAVSTDGNLHVSGNAIVDGVLTVEHDAIVRGDMFTDGNFYMVGSLTVAGAQGLTVERDAIVRGSIRNDGSFHVVGDLRVDGQIVNPAYNQEERVITDYGAVGNGTFDNAPIINGLIAGLPASGGTIVVPHGEFFIGGPIVVTRSFVTIRGLNSGHRSAADGPAPGMGAVGGGSKLIVGGVEGIWVPVTADGRYSGIAIRDLCLRGNGGNNGQYGVRVQHRTDGLRIENIAGSNLRYGLFVGGADACQIGGCRLVECGTSLRLENCIQSAVSGNHMGGQNHAVTCEAEGCTYLTLAGNNLFPDGQVTLRLANSHHSDISGNHISSYYTGMVEIGGNGNTLSGNNLRHLAGAATDPAGRDGLWGLVRISGNDNLFTANTVCSDQPVDDTRLHVVNGVNNHLAHCNVWGQASRRKVVVGGGATGTRILYCCTSDESEHFSGSTYGLYFP